MLHQQNAFRTKPINEREGREIGNAFNRAPMQRDFNPINNRPDTNHRTNSIQFSIGATFETANIETHSFSS